MNAPNDAVLQIQPLGFPWETIDPVLFCVYHDDAYPKGNGAFGPAASLAGRGLGQAPAGKDGRPMAHSPAGPGFPTHRHPGSRIWARPRPSSPRLRCSVPECPRADARR